jgi:hypothetical protein
MKKNELTTPVYAIGGIGLDDIPALMETGIHGIAVSGLITIRTQEKTIKQLKTTFMEPSLFKIGDKILESRLFLGKFGSNVQMEEAILASASELVTVALKRIDLETETDAILKHLQHSHINLLPNTSGARN